MALVIRMARGGKAHRPFYRIVVAEKRNARDGKFVERLGSYDPLLPENKTTLDLERAKYWLSVGALPSDRVRKLLALQGVEAKAPVHSKGPGKAPAKPNRKPRGKGGAAGGEAAAAPAAS